MDRRPPGSTLPDTLFPYTTPFRSQAYDALRRVAGLEVDADLDDDAGTGTDWNANAVFRDALDDGARVLGGGDVKDAVLSPLRQLSFWQMKDRSRSGGERGGGGLLRNLQGAATESGQSHCRESGCPSVERTGGAVSFKKKNKPT